MFTKMKIFATAALVALSPVAASAAVVALNAGGTTNIVLGNDYAYDETVTAPGADSRVFMLDATPPSGLELAAEFVTLEFVGAFQGLSIMLTNNSGSTSATSLGGPLPSVQAFSLDTVFNAVNGFSQTLTVAWTGVTGSAAQFDIQATPAQVPVPASGLLLLGALGGALSLRRRKSAAAA